jgi:hypothetical protein
VDRRHDPALDADGVVQHLGQRREAVRGAGPVGDHVVAVQKLPVVHAVDDGLVGVLGRGGDQHALGAAIQMHRRRVAVVELAGAFEDHVAALPVELRRVVGGEHLHRAAAEVHRVTRDAHLVAEAAMDAVVAQQVGVGLDRAGGVDLDHLNVVARGFGDMCERAAPDPAKSVDANRDRHETRLS